MTPLAQKLTLVMPVYNEAHRLELALRNFHGKIPIVIIDNYSHDETVAIAQRYATKIVSRKNSGFASADDYAFMFSQVETEWILIQYAGHYFSPGLVAAIEKAILSDNFDAICLSGIAFQYGKRTNVYGWNFRRKFSTTRLAKKKAIDLGQSKIHHELPYAGSLDRVYFPPLRSDYLIINFRDDDLLVMNRKTGVYCDEEARQKYSSGQRISGLQVAFSFLKHLFKRLIWRLAILEGTSGIIIAISESYRYFCVDARLWELTNKNDQVSLKGKNNVIRG